MCGGHQSCLVGQPRRLQRLSALQVVVCLFAWQVIGAPLAAAILSLDGLAGLRGWQWLFLMEGGVGTTCAVLLLPLVHQAPLLL